MPTRLENTEINTNNSQNVSDKIPVQIIQKEIICRSTDIGEIINKKSHCVNTVSDIWVPDDSYVFPSSGKRNLKFQQCWFKRWNWLAYSEKDDEAYCKYCVLFAREGGGVGKQTFGNLVRNHLKTVKML